MRLPLLFSIDMLNSYSIAYLCCYKQIKIPQFMKVTAKVIAQLLNGEIEGNPDVILTHPAKIEEATESSICFLANPKYEHYAYTTQASALLVSQDFQPQKPVSATLIRVKDVRQSVVILLQEFSQYQKKETKNTKDLASIDESAKFGEGLNIGAFSVIRAKAIIGNKCTLHEHVFIGNNVVIGNNVELYSGVKIMYDCVIGDNCIIHSNTVIGSDGFGFAPQEDGTYKKVPQIGNVVIGNNVEIGANTVIDRATMGSTVIKDGVKLDNLIQIAHNVEIGENTVIAAQAGIAGSAKIGKNCMIGGQVGIAGHLKIADGTKIQAQSGVGKNTKPNTAIYGSPAFAYGDFIRSHVLFKKLPRMEQRLHELEQFVKDLGIKK
jgi:UDP-3-O-[3-hydroxymyristoyl] glucosamine N-acyltransferase